MKKIKIELLLTFVLLLSTCIFPQSKTGTTIAQFLKIDPSARFTGMGNTGVALSGDVTAMFYNPASLGRIAGMDAQFTMNKWLADISYNYTAVAMHFNNLGTFAFQVTALNSGDIPVTTVDQPLGTGEKYTVNDFSMGAAFGMLLTDRVSVGVQFNYINETIWHSSLNAFGMNFGIQYQFYGDGPMLGASVSNFGTKSAYNGRDLYLNYDFDTKKYGDNNQLPAEFRTDSYNLPTIFRIGLSLPIKFSDEINLLVSADAIHPNDNTESINAGAELSLMNTIVLRGGFRNLYQENLEGGLVLGGGFHSEVFGGLIFRIDYAYADYGRLAQAHRITVGLVY